MYRSIRIPTLFCLFAVTTWAQDGYRLPPSEVVQIVDATPPPAVSIDPKREWMLLQYTIWLTRLRVSESLCVLCVCVICYCRGT